MSEAPEGPREKRRVIESRLESDSPIEEIEPDRDGSIEFEESGFDNGENPADQRAETPKERPEATSFAAPQAPPDLDSIFARLTPGAVRALSFADLLRALVNLPEVHVDHLIYALYRTNKPSHDAVAAKLDESAFVSSLQDLPPTSTADAQISSLGQIRELPRLSKHARDALRDARDAADVDGSQPIVGYGIFVAVMQLPDCTPVEALRAAGVTVEPKPPAAPFSVYSAAKADQPTDKDLIGYQKIVDSLAELLTGRSTTFPLTLAIAAPWGGGKSSLMKMLQGKLAQAGKPRWLSVEFPAWRYETGEQIWAAMAKATYDASLRQRNAISRWLFRIRLEFRRGSVVRTTLRVLAIGAASAIGAVLGAHAAPTASATGETGAVVGGVSGLLLVGQALWNSLVDPFKRAIESFAEHPAVQDGDGFTADAAGQVDALMRQLLSNGGKVAIFIDDLDRCAPRNLVRVVEAISQIFIAGSNLVTEPAKEGIIGGIKRRLGRPPKTPRLVFIMGMDRRVVARGIETEYSDLLDRMKGAGDEASHDYGLAFLDKIVQLWVTLPPPSKTQMTALLGNVAGIETSGSRGDEALIRSQRRRLEQALALREGNNRSSRVSVVQELASGTDPDLAGALQAASQEFLAEAAAPDASDSPMVWTAMQEGLDCLEANPRQIKRFNNAFRLQLNVAARSELVTFSPDQLGALARWVAIRLRWAHLAGELDDDATVLSDLENIAEVGGRAALLKKPDGAYVRLDQSGFDPESVADLDDLFRAIKRPPGQLRISGLPFQDFLPIA